MKRLRIVLSACVLSLAFCVPAASETLYSWYGYQDKSYRYLKKNDAASYKNLVQCYESIIKNQKMGRKTVPPGIYADYGWLLIKNGDKEKGIAMLKKEMELYPESSVFINRILQRFTDEQKK
ncbi:MAG: DUF4810 domain-containing protein [Treponema sp.]|nr:DUF4810 domain-containing protein [Treponema sp.]